MQIKLTQKFKKEFKKKINQALIELKYPVKIKGKKLNLYAASGEKSKRARTYHKIFVRDSFYSAFLLKDKNYLKALLEFCILTQGKKKNPTTGEGPGKILHEYPEFWIKNKSTKYNASDTTALFLIGLSEYYKLTKDRKFIEKNKSSIISALNYIFRHLKNGIFWDDPNAINANKYALRATYWRDGGLVGRPNFRLHFPASYLLLQAQLVKALRETAKFSSFLNLPYSKNELKNHTNKILKTIFTDFWNKKENLPIVAKDKRGNLKGVYSDFLHFPYYLEKKDIPTKYLKSISKISSLLKTNFGYLSYFPYKQKRERAWLWYNVIWPWEQAYIFSVGEKLKIKELKETSKKVLLALNSFSNPFVEYFYVKKQTLGKENLEPSGCSLQLWSVASLFFLLNS